MLTLAAAISVVVIEFQVLPDRRDEFVAITNGQVADIRALDGNVQFDVLIDEGRPDRVLYLERWRTRAQQEAFYEWWVARGMLERLRPLVTAAPKVTAYVQASE